MSRIPLLARDGTVRAYALVDAADVEWLSQWTWRFSRRVAARGEGGRGNYQTILMHRALLGMVKGDGREVDHRNRNSLDNRRANLREVTHAQNMQNMFRRTHAGRSRFRGVYWNRAARKWQAYCTLGYQTNYLGLFVDEEEAGRAAAEFRREHMPYSEEPVAA